MSNLKYVSLILLFSLAACSGSEDYKEKLARQRFLDGWDLQNMDVTKFRNGDVIPEAETNEAWVQALKDKKPAWCYYLGDSTQHIGKLYNFYAVHDHRHLAPQGMAVPSVDEWNKLFKYLKIGTATNLKSQPDSIDEEYSKLTWSLAIEDGHIRPKGGFRNLDGKFESLAGGVWWTSSLDPYLFETPLKIFYASNETDEEIMAISTGRGYFVRCFT